LRLLISATRCRAHGRSHVRGLSKAEKRFYDCRALTTPAAPTKVNDRLPAAAVLAISAVLLAALILAVAALGTNLLGVPTSYANGVAPSLGAQVVRDFLTDQDAEATALSNGDQGPLGGHLSDSALVDVIDQISKQSASSAPPQVSFQPASLTVLRASDPADSTLTIEVQEDGTETLVTTSGPAAAPVAQAVSFHGDFWLRIPSGSHYTIADQHIQTLPSSPLPAAAVVVAALVAVGLATVLVLRQRGLRPIFGVSPVTQPVVATALIEVAADADALPDPPRPPPEMVVRTFGGLHMHQGGKDWAQDLLSRPASGFVCLRLLVAAIRDPTARISRDEVARQANPGQRRNVQLKRLRNFVSKGLPEMPAALRDRIRVEPEVLSFKLEGCQVDAVDLLALSAECAPRSQLSAAQAVRAQRLLQACQGVFLPEFEAIEDLATDRHPTCTPLVRELRELLINKRVDLALLLADSYLGAGRPTQAIAILEPALGDRSQRKDIADRLAAAYRSAGRDAEAKALEARFV